MLPPNADVRISSPPRPFTVGEMITITCAIDYNNKFIQWLDNDMNVVAMTSSGHSLDYTFDPVSDSLHGSVFTCSVVDGVRVPSINITVNGNLRVYVRIHMSRYST